MVRAASNFICDFSFFPHITSNTQFAGHHHSGGAPRLSPKARAIYLMLAAS